MRLTYWKAENHAEGTAYAIRTRTRRECLEILAGVAPEVRLDYGEPQKVVLEYSSGFELAEACLSEDQGGSLKVGGSACGA